MKTQLRCQETESQLQGHFRARDVEGVDRWLMVKEEEHEHQLTQLMCSSAAALTEGGGARPVATPARAPPPCAFGTGQLASW